MPLCPQCGEEVGVRDTHCMDCGADLIAAKHKERQALREQSVAARSGTTAPTVAAGGAAAGRAEIGESSDETRIRAFDRQEAKRLVSERSTCWVLAGLALIAGVVLVLIALNRVKAGGGFGEIPAVFKPKVLRNFAVFGNATFLGAMLLGMGLSALMIAIGQVRMARAATRAILQVRNNIKPEIVQVSTFTLIGLMGLSVFCPPAGLIIGSLLFFGRNPDLKGIGGNMVMISLGVMVLFGLNMLAKLAQSAKPPPARSK